MSNINFLRKQLYSMRIKDGSLLREHLNEFNTLNTRFVVVGVKVEKEENVKLLLCLMSNWDGS